MFMILLCELCEKEELYNKIKPLEILLQNSEQILYLLFFLEYKKKSLGNFFPSNFWEDMKKSLVANFFASKLWRGYENV